MKEQSFLDIAWVCRKEIGKKVLAVLALAALLFVFSIALAYITNLLYGGFSVEDQDLVSSVVSGMGLLCGFSSENMAGGSIAFAYTARLVWVFVTFFLSAFVANMLARPINPIRILPLFVLNTDAPVEDFDNNSDGSGACPGFLEFRYWIRLVDGEQLYQVDCLVELTDSSRDNQGVNKTNPLFCHREEYFNARGVRVFRMPVNMPGLLEALNLYFDVEQSEEGEKANSPEKSSETSFKKHVFLRFRIMGIMKNGQRVIAYRVFRIEDFRNGYRFASIRKSECLQQPLTNIGGIEYMISAHFEKLYRCEKGIYEGESLGQICFGGDEILQAGTVDPCFYDRVSHLIHFADFKLRSHAKRLLKKAQEMKANKV